MNDDNQERSESGSPIYRHKPRASGWQAPQHFGLHLEAIEQHLARHVAPVESVFHEILSDLVHLDVLFVPATADRPYHLLVTSGVSDRRMNVPPPMKEYDHAELLVALPADWPLTEEAFQDEANYWPIGWQKMVGRMPHEYDTWIGWGHTIPNGDPPEPIANTRFVGVMLSPPYQLGADFFQLKTGSGETISFYALTPLYAEEMDFKLKRGAEALEEKFDEQNLGMVLNIGRPNVAAKRGWFRR